MSFLFFLTDNFSGRRHRLSEPPVFAKEMKTLSNQTRLSILTSTVPYAMLFQGQVQNGTVHGDYVQKNPRNLQDDSKTSIFNCPSMISVEMNVLCPAK